MSPDVTALRTVVLKGLPILLSEDSSQVYTTCFVAAKEEALASVIVGVLTVIEDAQQQGPNAVRYCHGQCQRLSSGSLPSIWVHVCPSLELPKMHGKHIQIHSSSHAWTQQQDPPSKTDHTAE